MDYSLSKVKNINGRQGKGFSCDLLLNGVKIGSAVDWANGSSTDFTFIDDNNSELFHKYANEQDANAECFITGMVDDYLNAKRFEHLCKKQTLFRVKGDKVGEYRNIAHVYDDVMKAHLAKKYGDKLVEVYNEKLVA